VLECERLYGIEAVEATLDACHSLQDFGVNRYKHPKLLSAAEERERQKEREAYAWSQFDDVWRTVPTKAAGKKRAALKAFPEEPQENLLYFIEKNAPRLAPWQRELVRIVRKMAQYFYPQGMTKVMNEGWATFWHYTLLNRLYDKKLVTDGFMLEVLSSHTNVITQRGFDQRGYGGINPYALGFAMFTDLRRMCEAPTPEDQRWFPDIAGADWLKVFDFAMRNFKDASFIAQYLSPRLIREFRLFAIADHAREDELMVDSIHNDAGYRRIRNLLSAQYDRDNRLPDIQVIDYARDGDRSLTIRHKQLRGRPLAKDYPRVLDHLQYLWGFKVRLEVTDENDSVLHFEEVDSD
jgi:spore cortex formation protein SpoVR/YcgB (stage V sporulation)